MTNLIYAFCALAVFGFLMLWMGYRLGYNNGLATWRKSYRYMSAKEISAHKAIINTMPDKV